jgi:hypothetical protein
VLLVPASCLAQLVATRDDGARPSLDLLLELPVTVLTGWLSAAVAAGD